MNEPNYEEILRRRQLRRKEERKRRRRQVAFFYLLIFTVMVSASVFAYTFFKGRSQQAGGAPQGNSGPEAALSPQDREDQQATGGQEESSEGSEESVQPENDESIQPGDGESQPEEDIETSENKEGSEESSSPEQERGVGFLEWLVNWFKGLFGWKDKKEAENSDFELPSETTTDMLEVNTSEGQGDAADASSSEETESEEAPSDLNTPEGRLADLLARANWLAVGYDYDGAIALLLGDSEFSGTEEVAAAVAGYESIKAGLVEQDISQIPHVFFHSIIIDTAKAFDGESDAKGYNQVMTTKSEFLGILERLYERGYVLVRLHDMAHEEVDENGNVKMVRGQIMLPEGKKAIVMSQDDLCYYAYMDGDGFANRIIIGEDGKPTCEMKLDDGTVVTGDYDLVPILEHFIQEHPDFSYKGARAVLAFTGYEGILGYRTAASFREKNENYEADCQQAALVAQCLRDNGWELASHSWGHRNLGEIEMEDFIADTNKWEEEVETLIGPTDIILYPFGADVADWNAYTMDNARYAYLHGVGFRYFCNVDGSQVWVQRGDDYLRQGRLNLDGYRLWQDIEAMQEGGSGKRRLDEVFHLFRAEEVFDYSRPTPVEWD